MNAGRIIAYVVAAIFIIFGFLFVLSAFGTQPQPMNILYGLVLLAIGFAAIWVGTRLGRAAQAASGDNVTLKIDLPANVNMDTLKCKSCGGALTPKDIKMVAGAPVVTCPYCNTTYQLTEEPKW